MLFKTIFATALLGLAAAAPANQSPANQMEKRDPGCSSGDTAYGHAVELNKCIDGFVADRKASLSQPKPNIFPPHKAKQILPPNLVSKG